MNAPNPPYILKAYRFFLAHGPRKTLRRASYAVYRGTIVRFRDWRFDRAYGVHTGGMTHYTDQCPYPARRRSVQYEGTAPALFERIMAALGRPAAPLAFYDMGCGKGRVLLMAASHGFKRVVGVEFDQGLAQLAAANVARFCKRTRLPVAIDVVCGDAAEYRFADEDAVIFFFNPFDEPILNQVLDNIRRSAMTTRERIIVYLNPVHASLFDDSRRFDCLAREKKFAIYRMRLEPAQPS